MPTRLVTPSSPRIYFDPPATQARSVDTGQESPAKDVLSKIAQLIPAEVLGAYGAALNTLPLFGTISRPWVALGLFVLGIIGTGWYISWSMGKDVKKSRHLFMYSAAFAVWAYSLTGATVVPWIFQPGAAALLPILFSVAASFTPLPKKEIRAA